MEGKTLKEVCELVGVTRRAVQGYEEARLVSATGKNKYGHLLYDEATVEKIQEIKQYQDFGFSIKEIKVLLFVAEDERVNLLEGRLLKMRLELRLMQANIEAIEQMIHDKRKS